MTKRGITTLFLDVGGVLLTNGWDRKARQKAATDFGLDYEEMEARHNLTFDTFEVGKLSLDDYLKRVVFYKKRPFSVEAFCTFMYAQSKPYEPMLALIRSLKAAHRLKVAVVSNEGRELNEYRIKKFRLGNFVDFFISSSYVHLRKPDADIYRLALDVAQVDAKQVLYIEDRPMFVEVAKQLGIEGIVHTDFESTCKALKAYHFGHG